MNYASETWDYNNNNSLELVHRKFCKFALGVCTNAPNLAVYGELGRTPLSIHRKILTVKYWCRLSIDDGRATKRNLGVRGKWGPHIIDMYLLMIK